MTPKEERKIKSEWSKLANSRTAEEWLEIVKKVKNPLVQIRIAGIIWWDWFKPKPKSDAWNKIMHYVDKFRLDDKADMNLVCKEMIKAGYPKRSAIKRCKFETSASDNKEQEP